MKKFILFSLILHLGLFLLVHTKNDPPVLFRSGIPILELGQPEVVSGKAGPPPIKTAETAIKESADGESRAKPDSGTPSAAAGQAGIPGLSDGLELGLAPPPYPRLSRIRGEEGAVILKLQLDDENHLHQASIEKSSGYPLLDEAALTQITEGLPTTDKNTHFHTHRIRYLFQLHTPETKSDSSTKNAKTDK